MWPGAVIDVWTDPWIPSIKGFRPRPHTSGVFPPSLLMKDLLTLSGQWNRQLVRYYFDDASANAIFKIPIYPRVIERKWFWALSISGSFPIRSLYQEFIHSRGGDYQRLPLWCVLWKMKIHPRHKVLWWRIAHDILPTREKLMNFFEIPVASCPICGAEVETTLHLL